MNDHKGYLSVLGRRRDINISVVIVDGRGVHQARHLALVFVQLFIVVVHGCFAGFLLPHVAEVVEMVAEPADALAAENAEYVALLLRELGRSISTEGREIRAQEGIYPGQTQVGESWAVVE